MNDRDIGLVAIVGGGLLALFYFFVKPAGGGGGLRVQVVTSPIVQGTQEQINISGATPNGTIKVDILTNTGTDLGLSDAVAGTSGSVVAYFDVGTNIPLGVNTVKITDLTTGKTAQAQFTVTITYSLYLAGLPRLLLGTFNSKAAADAWIAANRSNYTGQSYFLYDSNGALVETGTF